MLKLRKGVVATGTCLTTLAVLLLWKFRNWSAPAPFLEAPYKHVLAPDLELRLLAVEDAFQHAWNGYSKHCFGQDSLRPVSNSCDNDFGGLGATAIDALSTAILMEKREVVVQILEFIATVDFTKLAGHHTRIQSFEVIIRHFAGMISAYDLLTGPFSGMEINSRLKSELYTHMVALGDILTCSFNTGPLAIPRGWVDPKACNTDDATSNTIAGVGTTILEFARLSDITGNTKYVDLARKAESFLLEIHAQQPFPGLLGSHISIGSGTMVNSNGGWGAFSDSYYEYLIKAYIYDEAAYTEYLSAWLLAADSTIRHIGSHPYGFPTWTLLPTWSGTNLNNHMDSLSWFAGGSFILGGMVSGNQTLVDFGLSIADTAGAIYNMTATGLGPEYVEWSTECNRAESDCKPRDSVRFVDTTFKSRPEVLETWYYAYRATRDPKYREWSWSVFQAINKYCKTDSGFSAISNVDAPDGGSKTDLQESFMFAEVMKYIYLTHSEDDLPYQVQDSRKGLLKNTWVFNTEAHLLRVQGRPV